MDVAGSSIRGTDFLISLNMRAKLSIEVDWDNLEQNHVGQAWVSLFCWRISVAHQETEPWASHLPESCMPVVFVMDNSEKL